MAGRIRVGELAREIKRDLRANLRSLFVYHLFFVGLAATVISPASSWLMTSLTHSGGRLTASNEELLSFLLSPVGALWLLIAATAAGMFAFAEHSGMVWIVWRRWKGERAGATAAIWRTGQRLPALLALSGLQAAAHLAVFLPLFLVAAASFRWLGRGYDLNYFVSEKPAEYWAAMTIVLLTGIAVVILNGGLYFRWIFSAPALLLEGLKPLAALRHSARLTHGVRRQLAIMIVGFGFCLAAVLPLVTLLFDTLGEWLLGQLPERPGVIVAAVLMFLGVYLIFSVSLAFTAVAGHALLVANLFQHTLSRRLRILIERSEPGPLPRVAQRHPFWPWRIELAVLFAGLAGAAWTLSQWELADHVEVTAHRGSSHAAPENTLSAIRQAIVDGADYAEIDVQELADGTLVLLHDTDLLRLAGVNLRTADATYEQVKALDVGRHFGPEFRGERIPTLKQAIEAARGQIKFNVELKLHGRERRLAERVVELLRAERFTSQVIITSLDLGVLNKVRELDPGLRIGYIAFRSLGGLPKLNVDALSVSAQLATPSFVVAAQRAGKEVHVWTINRPERMAYFIDLGVDNIITDRPDLLVELLRERGELSDVELMLVKVRNWLWSRSKPLPPATRTF